jgi:hypothetical protein
LCRIAVVNSVTARQVPLPGPCTVVSFGDPGNCPTPFKDPTVVSRRLHLSFHDAAGDASWAVRPDIQDARQVLAFVRGDSTGTVVCQCDAGAGRSVATAAALTRIAGRDDRPLRIHGRYDRGWYRLLLIAAGLEPDPEPLVSLAVRVKYPPDRLQALLLSLRRQRYTNWQAIAVTDGPDVEAAAMVKAMGDGRVTVLQTAERKGRWGHPHRREGLEACQGAFVGMANDDDYYVPGYLEQMVNALEWNSADLALCYMAHGYHGWSACIASAGEQSSGDVGNWIARAELVKANPWEGDQFDSDQKYIRRLAAAGRVTIVKRPLHVKN